MDKEKFLELQYKTLRKEIEHTKDRMFKIAFGGITIVPAAQFLAVAFEIEAVALLLPFLVIIIVIMFLAENNALMRSGRYIARHIEPEVKDIHGWEAWLEEPNQDNTRIVDRYIIYSFYLLWMFYYIVSVYLAGTVVFKLYGVLGLSIILGVYIAIGVWMVVFSAKSVKTATKSKFDHPVHGTPVPNG